MRGTLAAVLACGLVAVSLVAGCGGDRSAEEDAGGAATGSLTPAQLEGIWLLDGGDVMVRFGRDGTWAIGANGTLAAFAVDGQLETQAEGFGTYTLEGDEIEFQHEFGSEDCEPGETIRWRARLLAEGELEAVHNKACDPRGVGITWRLSRASPDSRVTLVAPETIPEPTIAPDPGGNLRGVWAIPGTSTLVALSDDGRYAWDDEGKLDTTPADSGRVAVDESGSALTFTSGAATRRCSPGDVLALESARVFFVRRAWGLTGTVTSDACGRVEGDLVLLVISL